MRILLLMVSISVMLGCNTNKDNNSFIILDYSVDYSSNFIDYGEYKNVFKVVQQEEIFNSKVDTIGYLFDKTVNHPKFRTIYKTQNYKHIMNTNDGAIYRLHLSHTVEIGNFKFDTLTFKFNNNLPSWTYYNDDERDVLVDSIIRANYTPINNDAEWELIVKPIN